MKKKTRNLKKISKKNMKKIKGGLRTVDGGGMHIPQARVVVRGWPDLSK